MSKAFTRFLEELRAEGPQKKDGFDRLNIAKLSPSERDEARRLLGEAIVRGDDTAVDGLIALDGPAALSWLRELWASAAPASLDEPVRVRIVRALVDAGSCDAQTEKELARLLTSKRSVVRLQALSAAERLRSAAAQIALLRPYLETESDALQRSSAARALLRAAGRAEVDNAVPAYASLLSALRGSDPAARRAALAELGI